MRDRRKILENACAAMTSGDVAACQSALDRFRASVAQRPLAPEEETSCAAQLERLAALAGAACNGIDSARAWLRELSQLAGGLDIYDRDGRQRVDTGLTAPRRF